VGDDNQTVVLSAHENRLAETLRDYRRFAARYHKKDEADLTDADVIEFLLSDLFLKLGDLGLDEQDIIDAAMRRVEHVRDHPPDA
jgi:hypothetical protein